MQLLRQLREAISHPTSPPDLAEEVAIFLPILEPIAILDSLRQTYPKSTFTFHRTQSVRESNIDIDPAAGVRLIPVTTTILVTLFIFPPPEAVPNLKLVHLFSAGANRASESELYRKTDIPFTSSRGVHGPQIAEHVFATLLSLTHELPGYYQDQQNRKWRKGVPTVHDLPGLTIGVLGYGSIGRQVANVGRAMGMRVLAYTASPKPTPESRRDSGYIVPGTGDREGAIPEEWYSGTDKESLHKFLSQSIDVLLVAVPLTDATRRFLSAEEFRILTKPREGRLKGKAYVINIARGGIIDTEALVASLKRGLEESEGGLGGASLDVTEPEPLPEDSELWGLKNVIITPHVSGLNDSYAERSFEIFRINLERLQEGEGLINRIDRKKGY